MDKIGKILCVCVPQNIFAWYGSQKAGRQIPRRGNLREKEGRFPGKCRPAPVLPAGRFGNNAGNTVLKYRKNAKSLFTIW